MHRRARHLNPGTAGAALALDSRFITGLNNGNPVTTWSDRSGGNRSPTESTNPPTYIQYGLNGSACVRFDGINDRLLRTSSDTTLKTLTRSVIIASRPDSTMSGEKCQFDVGDTYALTQNGTTGTWYKFTGATFTAPSLGIAYIFSATDSGANLASTGYVNGGNAINLGNVSGSFGPTSTGAFGVGTIAPGTSFFFKGDIGLVIVIAASIQSPLRRRLEHAAAFSFKIPCS